DRRGRISGHRRRTPGRRVRSVRRPDPRRARPADADQPPAPDPRPHRLGRTARAAGLMTITTLAVIAPPAAAVLAALLGLATPGRIGIAAAIAAPIIILATGAILAADP